MLFVMFWMESTCNTIAHVILVSFSWLLMLGFLWNSFHWYRTVFFYLSTQLFAFVLVPWHSSERIDTLSGIMSCHGSSNKLKLKFAAFVRASVNIIFRLTPRSNLWDMPETWCDNVHQTCLDFNPRLCLKFCWNWLMPALLFWSPLSSDGQEGEAAAEEEKKSNHVTRKLEKRQQGRKLDPHIEDQFGAGRLLACISSRPGQCGRSDG